MLFLLFPYILKHLVFYSKENILECDNIPVYANHLGQVLPAECAKFFAHAAHSKDMLPLMIVLLLLHDNLQPSAQIQNPRNMQLKCRHEKC